MRIWGVILLISLWGDEQELWQDAIQAFNKKQYAYASQLFQRHAHEYPDYSGFLLYNAGLAEFLQGSYKPANRLLQQALVNLPEGTMKSAAYNTLGCVQAKQSLEDEALSSWKLALKEDPHNEMARYNYELCLRRKKKKPPLPPDTSNEKPRNNPKTRNSASHQDKKSDNPLPSLNLNETENLLEAMENREKKFIQQIKKRNKGPKQYDGSNW